MAVGRERDRREQLCLRRAVRGGAGSEEGAEDAAAPCGPVRRCAAANRSAVSEGPAIRAAPCRPVFLRVPPLLSRVAVARLPAWRSSCAEAPRGRAHRERGVRRLCSDVNTVRSGEALRVERQCCCMTHLCSTGLRISATFRAGGETRVVPAAEPGEDRSQTMPEM